MLRDTTRVRRLMLSALQLRGISDPDCHLIVDEYLRAQMAGRVTHGLGKFLLLDEQLSARQGAPIVVKDFGAVAIVDGNRDLGPLAASFCLDVVFERLATNPLCAVGLRNFSRFGRLKPFALRIASRGAVGIVMNGAGPSVVAPPGSKTPLLGTNPLSIGIPGDPPFVVDLATSARPWGDIRQAILERRELDSDAFMDKDGITTRIPEQVNAVRPFGGGKGFALGMALELMCNGLLSGKAGVDVRDQFDLGAWFIALRADVAISLIDIQTATASLRGQLLNAQSIPADAPVRIPGAAEPGECGEPDEVEVDETSYELLLRMATESNVGLKSSNLLD